MVMQTIQIRLTKNLVDYIDGFVKTGRYSSRSDAIRDLVRIDFWQSQLGTMKFKGSGVSLVRKVRKILSRQNLSLEEMNAPLKWIK